MLAAYEEYRDYWVTISGCVCVFSDIGSTGGHGTDSVGVRTAPCEMKLNLCQVNKDAVKYMLMCFSSLLFLTFEKASGLVFKKEPS